MAHIKGSPFKGHVEGDQIWDRQSNKLYNLRMVDGKLEWDIPEVERDDKFWRFYNWLNQGHNAEHYEVRSGVKGTALQKDAWNQRISNAYVIRDGKVYTSTGQELTGPIDEASLYVTDYNSNTAMFLKALSEEKSLIRKQNKNDKIYLNDIKFRDNHKKRLEKLSLDYNIPLNKLLSLDLNKPIGEQLDAGGFYNWRTDLTNLEKISASHGKFSNLKLLVKSAFVDPLKNELEDYKNPETGVFIPGEKRRKTDIPIPVLERILTDYNSRNNSVETYESNNPKSLNVRNNTGTNHVGLTRYELGMGYEDEEDKKEEPVFDQGFYKELYKDFF